MREELSEGSDIIEQGVELRVQQPVEAQIEEIYREDFALRRELPENLAHLDSISMNFAWSWLPDGVALLRDIDPSLWDECEQNARLFLNRVSDFRLWQRALDHDYLRRLWEFQDRLERYLSVEAEPAGIITSDNPAAYFCAEFGVHNSLPIYSGGLGILAGDHLKSASDLKVPLVAIGLLYRFGYFRQRIAHNGWQEEHYKDVFASELAIAPVKDETGERVIVAVHIRGREVKARVWLASVGRVKLYLLDTNLPQNEEVDRLITGHLYGGSAETRIVQEKLLGIGGVRLLRKLGIDPPVFHLNEGHSAFLTLELAHEYLRENPGSSFEQAREAARQQCVFTTHTPVSAGNDAFDPATLLACFSAEYLHELKLAPEEFIALGRTDAHEENELFGMTPFAIRMSRSANGVSKKHGEVSRALWHKMFPHASVIDAVPITSVTNGVHPPTWIAPSFQRLYAVHMGRDWPRLLADPQSWAAAVERLPDAAVWDAHSDLKRLLIAFVRKRLQVQDSGTYQTINEHLDTHRLLSPDVLTIGFARRVAAYKRWNLVLSDVGRLLRLVDHPERPVQFVFAGKAHPQDRTAKQILQQLMSINHDSNWQNRAVFIEDYDQEVARFLVRGVDVWMNVPRRPLEASGTSGMKAAMNGVLNLSVLDGWWIEGYNGENGYSIADLSQAEEAVMDERDAESLFATLENRVVPAFYSRSESGLPVEWIHRMKNAIATLTPQFSTDRMVSEYVGRIYLGQET